MTVCRFSNGKLTGKWWPWGNFDNLIRKRAVAGMSSSVIE